jgi:cytochrome c oxidase assembly protein Cox11
MDRCFFRIRYLLTFFVLFLSAGFSAASVENVLCSEHFFFDGLKFEQFYADRVSYAPGDNMTVKYEIMNAHGSPLVGSN